MAAQEEGNLMADLEERGRGHARRPGRRSFVGSLAAFVLIVAVGGAGYLAWRYHQATGTFHLDKEKLKAIVSNEVDGAKAKLEKTGRVVRDASIRTIADARRLLVSVEAWLKERKVSPATREELEDADERYARDLRQEPAPDTVPAVAEPSGAAEGPPETLPADTSPEPVATRAATEEEAALVRRGRAEFRSGLEHWRAAGEPGSPREQEELALARERFTSAQDILTRAQERAPDDPEIEKLLVDTNRFLYDCLKRLKFDVRAGA